MNIYCTYITIYSGNNLPPFYIGSSTIQRIKNGYHGSVQSKRYKPIWRNELKNNPHLFKTIILTKHSSKNEAVLREQTFQRHLNVIRNPLYTNLAIGLYSDWNGRKHTLESKNKMSISAIGRKYTSETMEKFRNRRHSQKTRLKMSQDRKGRNHSIETIKKMRLSKLGRKKINGKYIFTS